MKVSLVKLDNIHGSPLAAASLWWISVAHISYSHLRTPTQLSFSIYQDDTNEKYHGLVKEMILYRQIIILQKVTMWPSADSEVDTSRVELEV